MKKLLSLLLLALTMLTASAQRTIDKLDRGLIGIKVNTGVFLSWRIQADEYYDVKYNLYRDGKKIAENLNVSNYTDAAGTTSSSYTVAAVVRGKEQTQSAAVKPWAQNYFEISPKHAPSLKCTYIPNDACCADVDGDGVVEILLKLDNDEERSQLYPKEGPEVGGTATKEYTLFEVLSLDGTVLWWVNCGPNMGDFQNNEQNIVGYDWDMDGKAEVVMRLAEGSSIHMADGTTYTIGADGKNGTTWNNYRKPKGEGSTEWFTCYGNEFLVYCNGQTGVPYQCIEFPLKRFEAGETDLKAAWGDGYGHRASKFFFGAPYLDGRHPSIFLGRGIYTRHKFIAYDVNPETHALTVRWQWTNNKAGSPWYGQGYHNYAIVDVDWDGRDEIVFGSMVIDDNGKGLSTTGLGHGDAQHHGDLDPYTYGQEGFFCNESQPANNYRDLTTSKIYHRYAASGDDGRAIAGNFCNDIPGAMGFSGHENAVSCVTGNVESILTKNGLGMNFRIYWDGDLQEESFDGTSVSKYNRGVIATMTGALSNNSTKATPTYQGDILGDWREEVIERTADNKLRIFTTTTPTPWRNYSLWYDKQYRNAMVWQMCGYNQPPHTSYFLGELENITVAPPAETMEGRKEIANGATISNDGETIITCETGDMTLNVADGATPYLYIDNAPSWVQGNAPSECTSKDYKITYQYYTHTLKGGAFAGDMRLVKQGAGTLVLPDVEQTYSGNTDVWAGTLRFSGTLKNSRLWLNRLTNLITDGGKFEKGIQADYGSVITVGTDGTKTSSITADSLNLGFGAIVALDIFSDGMKADQLNLNVLKVEKKVWKNGCGPAYDTPVLRITPHALTGEETIADGDYVIGTVAKVEGSVSDIVIEGLSKQKCALSYAEGKLILNVQSYQAGDLVWTGSQGNTFDLDNTANFKNSESEEAVKFTTGSDVLFPAEAAKYDVTVSAANGAVVPKSITFDNASKPYTLSGDSICGDPTITKTGDGAVYINNVNHTGNTTITGGILYAASLANNIGNDYGSLGNRTRTITISNGSRLGISKTATSDQPIKVGEGGAGIYVASGATLTQKGAITGLKDVEFTKTGAGALTMPSSFVPSRLVIMAGDVNGYDSKGPANIEFRGGSYIDTNTENSYSKLSSNFIVEEGQKGKLVLDPRCEYTGKLTGAGVFTVVAGGVRNTLSGNWSAFEGELIVQSQKRGTYAPSFDWNNSYGLPLATLNVQNGYTFNTNGKTVSVKTLKASATGTIAGTGTLELGEKYDNNINLTNYISCPLKYRGKEGKELRIAATSAGRVSANITVESGALRFTGNSSNKTACNGNKIIYVKNSGKVYGSNSLFYAIQASAGSVFSITGTSDAPATVTITDGGRVTIGADAVLDLKLKSLTSYSKLKCNGSMSFYSGGIIRVRLEDGYVPSVGSTFTLWTANSVSGLNESSIVLSLPELPAGSKWDTSELYAKEGVLKVVKDEASAIDNLPATAILTADVFTTDGILIGNVSTTKANLKNAIKALTGKRGNYVLQFTSGTNSGNVIVNVR